MEFPLAECTGTNVPLLSNANVYLVVLSTVIGMITLGTLNRDLVELVRLSQQAAISPPGDPTTIRHRRPSQREQLPTYEELSAFERGMPPPYSTPDASANAEPTEIQAISSAQAFVHGTILLVDVELVLYLLSYTLSFYRYCSGAGEFAVNLWLFLYLMLSFGCGSAFACWAILGARLFGVRFSDDITLSSWDALIELPALLVRICQGYLCPGVLEDEEMRGVTWKGGPW